MTEFVVKTTYTDPVTEFGAGSEFGVKACTEPVIEFGFKTACTYPVTEFVELTHAQNQCQSLLS